MHSSGLEPCLNCKLCIPWTDDPSNFNKVVCRICQVEIRADLIKNHVNTKHKMTYRNYLENNGSKPIYVNKRYHKCRICNYIMLFNRDLLQAHSKSRHNITLKRYIATYLK